MKRRYLILSLVLIVLATAGAIAFSYRAAAPKPNESASPFKDGEQVSVEGEAVCLEHSAKGDVQTLECASGLKATDGTVFALRDTTRDYSLVMQISSAKKARVEGIYRTSADTKYIQSGTIEVTGVLSVE